MSFDRRTATACVLAAVCSMSVRCASNPQHAKELYLRSGERFLERGQFPKSIGQLRHALAIDPNYVEALIRLGEAHLANQDWAEGYQTLQRVLQLDPMKADAHLGLGRLYLSAREFDKAEGEARAILNQEPHHRPALQLLGAAKVALQEPEAAAEVFSTLVSLVPNDGNAHMNLAVVRLAQGNLPEAEREFVQTVAVAPSLVLGHVNLAAFYRLINRPREAVEVLERAVRANGGDAGLTVSLAEALRLQGDEDRARDLLRQLASTDPVTVSDYYARRGEPGQAAAVIDEALQAQPNNGPLRLRQAVLLTERGEFDRAEPIVAEILRSSPGDFEAHLVNSRILIAKGKAAEATGELRRQIAREPKLAEPRLLLAAALQSQGRLALARQELVDALSLDSGSIAGLRALTEVSLALGDTPAAIEAAQRAVHLAPMSSSALVLLAAAHAQAGNQQQAAVEYRWARRLNPGDPAATLGLAQTLAHIGQWDAAEKELSRALADNPDLTVIAVELAAQRLRRKQPARALALLQAHAATHADDALATLALGSLQSDLGHHQQAVTTLEPLAQRFPQLPEVHLRLGELARMAGDSSRAIRHFKQYLEIHPKTPEIHALIGRLYLDLGMVDQAKASLKRSLEINADFAPSAGNLAWVEAEYGGDLNVALSLAQHARQLAPNDPAIADTLGWVHFKRARYAEAIELLKEAVERSPNSPVYRYHLGMTMLSWGDRARGRSNLSAALRGNLPAKDGATARQALSQAIAAP